MKHFVYMLQCDANPRRHYIGYTIDVDRRIIEHNSGDTNSTRPFRPWHVIYTEEFENRSDAMKREWYLKHSAGAKEKKEIIQKYGEIA